MSEQQRRGELTERVKNKSKEKLGYEINRTELRLMPYIQYILMNSQKLETCHVNSKELETLVKWKDRGFIAGRYSRLRITKDFWDAMNEILFLAYVDVV